MKARTEADVPELDKLTAQLILTFYGVDALQEYRADNSLVPITVYQTVNNLTRLLAKRELEGQSALITNIYNLANDIANKDPDMHGSEYLRHYHYTSALDREQKRLREELAKYGQDAVKPERRQ